MAMSTASPPRGGLITIASVPANHVYVRHLSAPDGSDAVRRLVDPRPCSAPSDQSVWWPPVMLDPQWIDRHHTEFDVFHLHFGFDAQTVQNLREVVSALRAHHKPLVFTVHDLRNPHHRDPAAHEGHLDVLVPAADQLITLTPGAAAAIAERWGRVAGSVRATPVYGGEDTDLGQVARALGVPIRWVGGATAFHQFHPVSDPPFEHLDDLLRNAAIFYRRWGWWPTQGWFAEFERSGLVYRDPESGTWHRTTSASPRSTRQRRVTTGFRPGGTPVP
jgi:hypothetical protein